MENNKAVPESIEIPLLIGEDNDIQEAEVFFLDQKNREQYTLTINSIDEYLRKISAELENKNEFIFLNNDITAKILDVLVWNDKLNKEIIRKIISELDLDLFSKFITKVTNEIDFEEQEQ